MDKEIRVPHKEINDPQTITDVNKRVFAENGLDFEKHESVGFEDDFSTGERVIRVRSRKYFSVPDLPWLKKESDGD